MGGSRSNCSSREGREGGPVDIPLSSSPAGSNLFLGFQDSLACFLWVEAEVAADSDE
jgi:hypothetical protein